MDKFVKRFSKTTLVATAFAINSAWSTGLFFTFDNNLDFTKINVTTEDLDRKNFKGTAATTAWNSDREFMTYIVDGQVIYQDTDVNMYAKILGSYGWVIDGKSFQYPLRWDLDGNQIGFDIESGYIWNVNKRFDFVPHAGFSWGVARTKMKHQQFTHRNPSSFISQNRTRSKTILYYPYVGIELDFISNFDVEFTATYEFGYVFGSSRDKVPHFFITDDPNTSLYGSRTKYSDMISQNFDVSVAYNLTNNWIINFILDYQIIYNTHKLPVKFDHNKQIVKTGQFTPSQYHVVSDYVAQNFQITFSIIYSLPIKGRQGIYVY